MFNQLVGISNAENQRCDCCGAYALNSTIRNEYFNYKSENGEVIQLSAMVPVWSCDACGDSFTDSRAEDLRHEAVCHYLGRLTPSELRDLRENNQCSQAEWSRITGLGIASIKRWESGALIQNLAIDKFLRLLRDRQIFRNLLALATSETAEKINISAGVFRTEISATAYARASTFRLRPTSAAEV
ncbi:type II TA system antitoxin MqsA family protein [Bradyrhizobium sp. TM233]|uniref:type II TA system antitoxin MqsA family protein n=1 Tax=Bradyrhizobium sp. TM233 TaxID=2599801 RepID=UPI00403E32A9